MPLPLSSQVDSYLLAAPSVAGIASVAIETLGRSGLPPSEIADAYNAWAGYVFGFSMLETLPGPQAKDRELAAGWLRAFMGAIDPDERPTLAAVSAVSASGATTRTWASKFSPIAAISRPLRLIVVASSTQSSMSLSVRPRCPARAR